MVFIMTGVSKGRKDGGRGGKKESIGDKERKRIKTWTKVASRERGWRWKRRRIG